MLRLGTYRGMAGLLLGISHCRLFEFLSSDDSDEGPALNVVDQVQTRFWHVPEDTFIYSTSTNVITIVGYQEVDRNETSL